MGKWLTTYGPSIYGTRGGPVSPRSWGATTRRGDTIFVHVLDWPDRSLSLPPLGARVVRATMLKNAAGVEFAETRDGVTLMLPPPAPDEPDRVILLLTRSR
jgi:alpha-L-fucosidase